MEGQTIEKKSIDLPKRSRGKILRYLTIFMIALAVGYFHYTYVSVLHENSSHFSHLSELEREMYLRTEMGFYYSYYKTVVQEHPFLAGISKLMYDRHVEYPKEVNAFNRFNIHPEVMIGALYRYLEPALNGSRQCHMVSRGDLPLPPVHSCVGIGHPIIFYLEAIWTLAGVMAAAIFLLATQLSESILGGVLSVVQYLANHDECTRVMWTPNERESIAAPLVMMQSWLLTAQLRETDNKACFRLQVSIFALNVLCLLFWQFTQFIFLTQMAIYFVMEQLRIIDLKTLCIFLHAHFCGLHMAVLLLQGNDMLKSSMYVSFFFIISTYCLFFTSFRINVKTRSDFFIESWLVVLRITIVVTAAIYLKQLISDLLGVQEDNHIWELLYSKFSNYKTFHTLMYTTLEVFDFLPLKTVVNYTRTLLIPFCLFAIVNVLIYCVTQASNEVFKQRIERDSKKLQENDEAKNKIVVKNVDEEDSGIESTEVTQRRKKKNLKVKKSKEEKEFIEDDFVAFFKYLQVDPAVFYNVSQMVVYGVMAALVMRLKLLFGTQMCVVSSLVVNRKYQIKTQSSLTRLALGVLSASLLIHKLYVNMTHELSIVGEFSDVNQEEFLLWVSRHTSAGSVFAGSMPCSAAILLSTRRAIVAHPHYEHKDARDRAYAVYKMYGRFSPHELYQELTKLQVTYLVVETKYCYGRSRSGLSYQDIWDIEAPSYTGRPKLCHTILTEGTDHLYRVFANPEYSVFRVHDLSVRYMPRVFDS